MNKAHPANRSYRVVAAIVRPLLLAMTKRDWRGAEHLPTEGGYIAAGNHLTNIDPLTFAHYLYDNGVAPRILAKSSLFKVPVLGAALRRTGQIPVHRHTSAAGDALAQAIAALRDGECVVVFPEGTLTREPNLWPMEGKTGIARLALSAQVPVIPIAQWGMQAILPHYSRKFRPLPPKRVWVHAGPPVDLSDLYGKPQDGVVLREATERVMAAITELLAEIRGEEPPATRFTTRKVSQPDAAAPVRVSDAPSAEGHPDKLASDKDAPNHD